MTLDEKEASADAGRRLVSIPTKDLRAVKSLADSALGFGGALAADVEMTTEDFDTLKAAVYFASERLSSFVGKPVREIVEPSSEKLGGDIDWHPKPSRSLTPFIARQWIAMGDAAELLSESNEGEYVLWVDTLMDAADSQQIVCGAWFADRSEQPLFHMDIRQWCAAHGYAWPVPLPQGRQPEIPPGDPNLVASLDQARARIAGLEHERDALLKKIEATATTAEATSINSPTLQRILDAVAQYPTWRATQNQEPNLKAVLSWQEKQQDGKGNASRVAHVAHHIIAEHFGLKS